MTYIFLICALFLDGILSIYIPQSSYFLPLLTVITIYNIYPIYINKKTYYITLAITGIIYDLMYTNLLFYHASVFLLLGYITKLLHKNLIQSPLKNIIYSVLIIILYETTSFSIVHIFRINQVSIIYLSNKISKTILLNIIYSIVLSKIIKLKMHKTSPNTYT